MISSAKTTTYYHSYFRKEIFANDRNKRIQSRIKKAPRNDD
jgi:hypothetical protein